MYKRLIISTNSHRTFWGCFYGKIFNKMFLGIYEFFFLAKAKDSPPDDAVFGTPKKSLK
jgi:hypothetical protein